MDDGHVDGNVSQRYGIIDSDTSTTAPASGDDIAASLFGLQFLSASLMSSSRKQTSSNGSTPTHKKSSDNKEEEETVVELGNSTIDPPSSRQKGTLRYSIVDYYARTMHRA